MRLFALLVLAAVVGFGGLSASGCTGCVKAGAFHCATSADCVLAGAPGTCEAVGYCSFPDPRCESGHRFGEQSGPYANECSEPGDITPRQVSIGGAVSGLVGSGLVLQNNGGDDKPITSNGAFAFASTVLTGDPFAVTISSQPTNPSQVCTVTSGAGTAGATDVTDVDVSCATTTYLVGGTVLGLIGTGMVLTNNTGDDKSITSSGAFSFSTSVASGSAFSVAIKTQPSGQTCSVSGGTGTVGVGNVTSVVINCNAGTFTIGGTTTGLNGTVVLRNNGGDNLTLTSNGSFAFPTPLATGTGYAVTVLTQPSYPPRSQTCVVGAGTGTVGSANITNVTVTCTTNTFSVGGSVAGLAGTLVLENNGGDTLNVAASGAFTFATRLASGATYSVSIKTQPAGQSCVINAGGSGTVAGSNITSVMIACSSGSDPGILCGSTYCDPATSVCCVTNGVPACAATCNGAGVPYACDSQQDCATAGNPQTVCCGSVDGTAVYSIYCGKATLCTSPKAYYCDPNIANPCPNGGTCMPTPTPVGYYRCF